MSTQSFEPINGTLSCEDWEIIVDTLRAYCADQEETLVEQNSGDKPYNVLARISAIADDISVFIVPMDRFKEETNG